MQLTQARLKAVLVYEPETGKFKHLRKQAGIRHGSIAGSKRPDGYLAIRIDGNMYLAHRLAFLYMEGRWPSLIDHKDRNKANNKWNNLHETSYSINNRNSKMRCTNTSGYKGVSWQRKSRNWKAYITINKKMIHIGHYKCPTAAYVAVTRFLKHHKLSAGETFKSNKPRSGDT